MTTQCFWVEVGPEMEFGLRRYASGDNCPNHTSYGYHEARNILGRSPLISTSYGGHDIAPKLEDFAIDDPRWPTRCEHCDYVFEPDDNRQVWKERIFMRPDTKQEWTEHRLPPGAMLDGSWHPQKGPDGIALVVVLPPATEDTRSHWWHVDGPSRNNGVAGPGWTRSGDPRAIPPTLTVAPSIATSDYHGFLQNGVLGPDLEAASRTKP